MNDLWLLHHPKTTKTLLVLSLVLLPFIGLWWGTIEAFEAWRNDWRYLKEMTHDDQ